MNSKSKMIDKVGNKVDEVETYYVPNSCPVQRDGFDDPFEHFVGYSKIEYNKTKSEFLVDNFRSENGGQKYIHSNLPNDQYFESSLGKLDSSFGKLDSSLGKLGSSLDSNLENKSPFDANKKEIKR